jgi:hypothetical protein
MSMIGGLKTLERFGLNYLCLNENNVLVSHRNSLDQSFALLFTPYLTGAVGLINENQNEDV